MDVGTEEEAGTSDAGSDSEDGMFAAPAKHGVGLAFIAAGTLVAAVAGAAAFSSHTRITTTSAEAGGRSANAGSRDADGRCLVPDSFCNTSSGCADGFTWRDCDGDGILDPYCVGGELLRFGFLSSVQNCESNWPNGVCVQPAQNSNKDVALESGTAAGNEVTIIHFNDVYQVAGVLERGVRRGGLSRAAHVIREEVRRNPHRTFAVFAGDLLSPSPLSDLFKGEQMIDVVNRLGLDAASLGNHEFDFGVETLAQRLEESNFPWLNINLMDEHGKLFPGTTQRMVRNLTFTPRWSTSPEETRVCIFGSAYDVRETMFRDIRRVRHKDALNASLSEVKHLREQEGCKVVLALTHQFSVEDCKLSAALGEDVDLILGGHDHSTELTTVCGHAPYAKADSDLKTQWVMTLWLGEDGRVSSVDGRLVSITDVDPFDQDVHDRVVEWENKGFEALGKRIGCIAVELDSLAIHVRQQETDMGNFFTDSVKEVHRTDVVMVNGGSMKGNKRYAKGDLTRRTIAEMHPYGNAVAKIYATGGQLRRYIEAQLHCYETFCGNFVNAAGLNITFRPGAPAGQRLEQLVYPNGTRIGEDDNLTVAMTDYMLASSDIWKNNRLYNMVTLNDAVPLTAALVEVVERTGESCISPRVDGRLVKL